MASSSSPEYFEGDRPIQGAPQGGLGEDNGPLSSLNIGFLKNLSDKKKARGMTESSLRQVAAPVLTMTQMESRPSAAAPSQTASRP